MGRAPVAKASASRALHQPHFFRCLVIDCFISNACIANPKSSRKFRISLHIFLTLNAETLMPEMGLGTTIFSGLRKKNYKNGIWDGNERSTAFRVFAKRIPVSSYIDVR